MRKAIAIALAAGVLVTSASAFEEHCFSTWEYLGSEAEAEASTTLREVWVDTAPFTGRPGGEMVRYDLDAALGALSLSALDDQPAWVVGVRLVLSEVGPDRMVGTRWGLLEAIGALQTVNNRLDPDVWNPEGVPGVRPWPGCGDDADFVSCANPDQYLGLRQRRALSPRASTRDRAQLLKATDLAVAAWWLSQEDVVPDLTRGATSFVHRCGGRAYGELTLYCDGSPSPPDVSGAEANTGPLVLKGPKQYLRRRGRYDLGETGIIDHVVGGVPTEPGVIADYLWGGVLPEPDAPQTGEG